MALGIDQFGAVRQACNVLEDHGIKCRSGGCLPPDEWSVIGNQYARHGQRVQIAEASQNHFTRVLFICGIDLGVG